MRYFDQNLWMLYYLSVSILTQTLLIINEIISISRSPRPPVVVPASLRETIYDVTTPKSEKVKRHLSDRVMTPKGGRPEAVPFIKDALTKSRNASGHHQPHGHHGNSNVLKTRLPNSNRC